MSYVSAVVLNSEIHRGHLRDYASAVLLNSELHRGHLRDYASAVLLNSELHIEDVWFIVTRAYMLVKFVMDTEQILVNTTNIFFMHSFISGHKKVEYIFRNRVSIAHVTVFIIRQYTDSQSYCSSLMIDSWSTASDARQPCQRETVSFYR